MKKILGFVVAGAFALAALPAVAADYPVKARPLPPAPLWTWTGFYVGVHGGASWGTVESEVDIPIGPGITIPLASHGINGWLGGGQVGYNMQSNWLVVGIEGNLSGADIQGKAPCLIGILTCTTKIGWLADVSGRLGFVVDRALIYVKAGVAWADSRYGANFLGVFPITNFSDTRVGFLGGFGLEYAITPQWSAKVEYNYLDFGTETYAPFAGAPGVTVNIKQVDHLMKFGLNYKLLPM